MSNMGTPRQWTEDILGSDYMATTLPLGEDPDGEGEVVATVVKHAATSHPSTDTDLPETPDISQTAFLWVHGFSDYFFQRHVAEHFSAYDFYAVDLRKCGRSHRGSQRWHDASDLSLYFPDLYATMDLLSAYDRVVIIAHSTAGLTVPLWLDDARRHHPEIHSKIAGLILNSPWLDMMFPKWLVTLCKPIIKVLGKPFPRLTVFAARRTTYFDSLQDWEFDPTLKPPRSYPVHLGWIRAIFLGHEQIHKHLIDVGVPVLTLCSDHSYFNPHVSPEADRSDVILNVKQIQDRAPLLGKDVTVTPLPGARHDVFLSEPDVRAHAFDVTDAWLKDRHI